MEMRLTEPTDIEELATALQLMLIHQYGDCVAITPGSMSFGVSFSDLAAQVTIGSPDQGQPAMMADSPADDDADDDFPEINFSTN